MTPLLLCFVIATQASIGSFIAPWDTVIWQIATDSKCVFVLNNVGGVIYPTTLQNSSAYTFLAPAAGIFGCQIPMKLGDVLYVGGTGDPSFHVCSLLYEPTTQPEVGR